MCLWPVVCRTGLRYPLLLYYALHRFALGCLSLFYYIRYQYLLTHLHLFRYDHGIGNDCGGLEGEGDCIVSAVSGRAEELPKRAGPGRAPGAGYRKKGGTSPHWVQLKKGGDMEPVSQ